MTKRGFYLSLIALLLLISLDIAELGTDEFSGTQLLYKLGILVAVCCTYLFYKKSAKSNQEDSNSPN